MVCWAVDNLNFQREFQKYILIFLWVNLCLKVGDSVGNASCSSVTLSRVSNLTQIRPILVDIDDKVLVTITLNLDYQISWKTQ